MNCADVRLDEYLDRELSEPDRAAVDAHLGSCAPCRAELERSRKLEAVLRSVPSGAAPDADRFVQSVRARSRRGMAGRWFIAAAAGILIAFVSVLAVKAGPRPHKLVSLIVEQYAQAPSAALEQELRDRGREGREQAEKILDSSNVRLQFAAAALLFKTGDEATRERLLARFQPKKEAAGTWTLSEPGADDDDGEMVSVAVSLAVNGQDRSAMNVLQKLNRLNRDAQRRIVDAVVTLLHSTSVDVQRHALEIVKTLDIEFPLPALVDLLDSPELGDEALRFLKQETRKDFGKDKKAWLQALDARK